MRKILLMLLLPALAAMGALTGCIRDDIPECPPLRVTIDIRDRNYFNVDAVELEERLADSLPIASYTPTLHWTLRELSSGRVVDESELITLSGQSPTFSPDLCGCLPHGEYILTVWGGLSSFEPLDDALSELTFHPGGDEGLDIFLTNDTLLYDADHDDYTVYLERTKGKLIVEKIGLPEDITESHKSVTGLSGHADRHFTYGGETTMEKHSVFEPAERVVSKTLLSPSARDGSSIFSLSLIGPDRKLPPMRVSITMRRNELTVLRYVWDSERHDFQIYMLINDNWETVTHMGLD